MSAQSPKRPSPLTLFADLNTKPSETIQLTVLSSAATLPPNFYSNIDLCIELSMENAAFAGLGHSPWHQSTNSKAEVLAKGQYVPYSNTSKALGSAEISAFAKAKQTTLSKNRVFPLPWDAYKPITFANNVREPQAVSSLDLQL